MSSSGEEDPDFFSIADYRDEDEEMEDKHSVSAADLASAATTDWPEFRTTTTPSANADTTRRLKGADAANLRAQNRYSLPEPIPAVPEIPEHLLASGKRAILAQRATAIEARKETSKLLHLSSSPSVHIQRPSTSAGESINASSLRSSNLEPRHSQHDITSERSASPAIHTRRKSLPAAPAKAHKATLDKLESSARQMDRLGKGRGEDLFLELANGQDDADNGARPPSRSERASSCLSFPGKRRSLPSQIAPSSVADLRPKTSGGVFGNRLSSRLSGHPSDIQQHVERYRSTPSRAAFLADDAMSVSARSRSGRPARYTAGSEQPVEPSSRLADANRSSEPPQYGRRRPSFGTGSQAHKARPSQLSSRQQETYSESPGDSSEPKQSLPDSASVESQSPDTVWDELDDLKSRIKKLELTGKLPPTSGATVSNETSDRPRTATTAPTTIDSSPKHEKQEKKSEVDPEPEDVPDPNTVGGPYVANIHPFLHSALAKAKPLLNASLYRSLEATASDALQLAAMTGSAGPQGTAYSAAAIINGVTAVDRQVRRKADTMCRNLTDLCLALCEGKHEAPSIVSSPVTLGTSASISPTHRYPRNSLDPKDAITRNNTRPMSRLEARRVSILGSQAGSSLGNSPAASGEEMSASEQESTPSISRADGSRRFSSRAGSRLHASRLRRHEESGEDDDPTIRPASRAVTGLGRAKPYGPREYSTPQRSPSLRDTLVVRQANAAGYDGNRELSRVASLASDSGSRRRFTPPVLEEEGGADEYQPVSQPKRRITSMGQYTSRRAKDLPSRATSLSQRKQVLVE